MSIKSIWLSNDRLVELRDSLKNIDTELYDILNRFLECDCGGEYLVNIFECEDLRKLESLDSDYNLFNDVDTIYKAT